MFGSVRRFRILKLLLLLAPAPAVATPATHVWEKQELVFTAQRAYANAYTDVDMWVDLTGPGFQKRVYGFWDGGTTFRVRVAATAAGRWSWRSGSTPADAGLAGKSGSFDAIDWSEEEKQANPLRRGFLRATGNRHALEYPDGTPYFAVGDTWYPLGTSRFRWNEGGREHPIGPEAGFQDYVKLRQSQGFNWISMIAAFPNWMTDGRPWNVTTEGPDPYTVRSAWLEFGTNSAKNMDNEGGRPFEFPGRLKGFEQMFPNVDRLNPRYFQFIDRKIDYLNDHGFVPFIEASRRDASLVWSKYHKWPDSYARYIQYVWSRYQANNVVLAPVHLDIIRGSIRPPQYLEALDYLFERWGKPPFGTLLSANAHPSTLENWGEDSWVTLHQTGNMREHNNYWYLTEIFFSTHPKPALNGEPYYSGFADPRHAVKRVRAPGGTPTDDRYVRSGMYGSFLSGGLAGHVYGAEGIWGADNETAAPVKMWEAFGWSSGGQMRHLPRFAMSVGKRYQDLVPNMDLVTPNRTSTTLSYDGWSYCARTADREIFLAYFEADAAQPTIRGAKIDGYYDATWFDPRGGAFVKAGEGRIRSNEIGIIDLPELPSHEDWGLRLVYQGPAPADPLTIPLTYPNTMRLPVWPGKSIIVSKKLVRGVLWSGVIGMAFAAIGAVWLWRMRTKSA